MTIRRVAAALAIGAAMVLSGIVLSGCGGGGGDGPSTAPAGDMAPPTVSSTNPSNGATGVTLNSSVSATFSEAMTNSTLTTATFTLVPTSGGAAVAATVDVSGNTATFTPLADLAASTQYTATVTTGAKDAAGNALAANFIWSFTTGAAPDTTPPTVSSASPAANTESVAVDAAISATFSEAMDFYSITASTFTVSSGGAPVAGAVGYSGATATFTPSSSLAADTTYTATVTTGAKDLAGNPIAAAYSWSFTPGIWNRIFVTSVTGNGNLASWAEAGGNTGLAAGDAVCQARAAAGGLSGSFKAWLSDDNDDAYCRVHNLTGKRSANCGQTTLPASAGPWVRMDRFPFSATIDQLVSGKVYAPVKYDESGSPVSTTEAASAYFTGTFPTGSLHPGNPSPCSNWTSSALDSSVTLGLPDATTDMWLSQIWDSCASTHPLVCMQTGAGPALPVFASPGKKAFFTSVSGNGNLASWADAGGNTGLAAADAVCQARAVAGGLGGSFKAWLASSATSAVDRFTNNSPWVRIDGVKVADNKADLTDGTLFSAINQDEFGLYYGNYGAWAARHDGLNTTDNCNEWTDGTAAFMGASGIAGATGTDWASGRGESCDATFRHLYCLED